MTDRPAPVAGRPLHVRWLGRVAYADAHVLQRRLFEGSGDGHLLLLEHPDVYTLGVRADPAHVLRPAGELAGEVVRVDRGGDVTWHGPGQLLAYPVLDVPGRRGGGMADTVAWVRSLEDLVIEVLSDLGLAGATRLDRLPGVWVGERKICAVGVRLSRGRSMHGLALNVAPDLSRFDAIVPCGLHGRGVTSLRAEGVEVSMRQVVDALVARAARRWGGAGWDRQDVAWDARPVGPGEGLGVMARKPEWLRAPAHTGPAFLSLRRTMRELSLATVCEEAGCPNIFECWGAGTATFMINGSRCTRACGFCLVDTRRPGALDPAEPERVAEAVARMGLAHAVVTAVARDDLADGGAAAFAATVSAIRARVPGCAVEVLVPDGKGRPEALEALFAARPEVLNHNLETVARLQRRVRPSAGYARSLAVLARAKAAGLVVKSGLVLGMGETDEEVEGALADLAAVGVDIVTLGQYLRPTAHHLPVRRWVPPATFDTLRAAGEGLGIPHVEASPLTRSSYHAQEALAGALAGASRRV